MKQIDILRSHDIRRIGVLLNRLFNPENDHLVRTTTESREPNTSYLVINLWTREGLIDLTLRSYRDIHPYTVLLHSFPHDACPIPMLTDLFAAAVASGVRMPLYSIKLDDQEDFTDV